MVTPTQPMKMIINNPIYDQECWHFNAGNCKYGDICFYKHCQPIASSPYQMLLHEQRGKNDLLKKLLSNISDMSSKLSAVAAATVPPPIVPTTVSPTAPEIIVPDQPYATVPIVEAPEQEIKTPEATTTPTPEPTRKVDKTPTGIYFKATGQSPCVISTDEEKDKFVLWILNYIVDQPHEWDLKRISGNIVMCNLDSDITTGIFAVESAYSMLSVYGIKYRKLLDTNTDNDL